LEKITVKEREGIGRVEGLTFKELFFNKMDDPFSVCYFH